MPSVGRQLIDVTSRRRALDAAVGLGFLAGGALTATSAVIVGSLLGGVPGRARLAVAAAAVVVLLARELGMVPLRLPQRDRLVPSPRLDLPFPAGPFAFAAELGLGWRTVVPTSAPYGLLVAVGAVAAFPVALAAAAGWAMGRAVPVTRAAHRSAWRTGGDPAGARPDRWPAPPPRPTALVALALVLAGLVSSLGSV